MVCFHYYDMLFFLANVRLLVKHETCKQNINEILFLILHFGYNKELFFLAARNGSVFAYSKITIDAVSFE